MAVAPGMAMLGFNPTYKGWYDRAAPSGAITGDVPCLPIISAFERSSKRRKGYPSEQRVKKGTRVVHGNKELFRETGT